MRATYSWTTTTSVLVPSILPIVVRSHDISHDHPMTDIYRHYAKDINFVHIAVLNMTSKI